MDPETVAEPIAESNVPDISESARSDSSEPPAPSDDLMETQTAELSESLPKTPDSSEQSSEPVEPPKPPEPVVSPKNQVRIVLKTTKDKQTIKVDEDATVKTIKKIAADKFAADPEYLCLIFAGKMMEEDDTLETHSVKDGMTIHLIVKTAPRQAEALPKRPPADINQTPFNLGSLGGLVGLEALGMGSANFMELQNRLQTELLGNPDLLRRVLDNPLVQSLMNDSDNMKILIAHNPQMQDLMARHPEIRSMLNNSEILKHTAELARNPSMLQELMRNVEGCTDPESESTYTPATMAGIYREVQPAAQCVTERVVESQKRAQDSSVFNNPQMSSLLQQMCENPQLVQNMLSAPYTQAMLQAMTADPVMALSIVNDNPLLNGNPQLQQYMGSMMPQLVNQLQNSEIQNMMASPQAVNALLQIQEGMDQLRNVAPGLVNNIGLGSFADYSAVASNVADSPSSDTSSTNPPPSDSFSQFMARMVASMGQSTDVNVEPKQRFKVQLEYLKSMGFDNEDDNVRFLTANFGDINATVQRLLAHNTKKMYD